MQIEVAEATLLGDREENQDRAAALTGEHASLLLVMDGMGGHSDGALAAETGRKVLLEAFKHVDKPLFDPQGFLHLALGRAHAAVAKLGIGLPYEARPRATCAVCVVQRGEAWWAHIGDSRVYVLRAGNVLTRTRDHSHVEQLLREGAISEHEVHAHPMRNYVECCLGGERTLPEMSVAGRQALQPGDTLLACTDGLWSGLKEADIGSFSNENGTSWSSALNELAKRAVKAGAPHSDNASVVALRWLS